MNPFRLALRNILRNYRRSLMTVLALAVGTMAVLVFDGYVEDTVRGLQTSTVRSTGHLQVVVKGYFEFGRGNPARFAMANYEAVAARLRADPQLAPLVAVITPVLDVEGIASSAGSSTTTSFSGIGVVPNEYARQLSWDGFDIGIRPTQTTLDSAHADTGIIGQGLAQILGLCRALKVDDCHELAADPRVAPGPALPGDIASLGTAVAASADRSPASIDLLASTASGNPNVVRMTVGEVKRQAIREIDTMFVAMPLGLAQRLVFGSGARGASAIVVQLKDTGSLAAAQARIETVLGSAYPGLEVVPFDEISSTYDQIVQNYGMIFAFIAALIAIITLFSIANAINMAVSERTGEIGTLRALGFQRGAIRRIFLAEGAMLGLIGTLIGVALAILIGEGVINLAGLSWTPPGRSTPVPIRVDILATHLAIPFTIVGLTVTAVISAIIPASHAARLNITEALRHV